MKSHLSSIMSKLQVNSRLKVVVRAYVFFLFFYFKIFYALSLGDILLNQDDISFMLRGQAVYFRIAVFSVERTLLIRNKIRRVHLLQIQIQFLDAPDIHVMEPTSSVGRNI